MRPISGEHDVEHRVQEAIRARTSEVHGLDEEAALNRIEHLLAARNRRGYLLVGGAAAVLLLAAAVAVSLARRDGTTTVAPPAAGASSLSSPPPGGREPTPPDFAGLPVWPASSSQRFDSPEAAARGFAVDYLGIPGPSVELSGDNVLIRAHGAGATTVVETRNTPSGWIVIGARTDQIVLEGVGDGSPAPATVSGRASTFEAQIVIEVRPFGSTAPAETTTAMGGSTRLAPFSASLRNTRSGVLVLRAPDVSGRGASSYATVVRIGNVASPAPSGYDGTILAMTPSGNWLNVTSAQPAPAPAQPAAQPTQSQIQDLAGANLAAPVERFVTGLGRPAHATLRSERDLAYVDRNGHSVWNLDLLTGRAEVLFNARHPITSLDANVLGGLIFTDDQTGLWRWDSKATNPSGPVKMADGYVDALW